MTVVPASFLSLVDYQGLARVDEIRVFDVIPAHQIQHRYAPVIGDLDEGIAAFDGVADLLAPRLGCPAARLRKLFVVYVCLFLQAGHVRFWNS